MKEKIVLFTGAGISAESGLRTFRDMGGLWHEYAIEEVATPEGWRANLALESPETLSQARWRLTSPGASITCRMP